MPRQRRRIYSRGMVDPARDLPALTAWLEQRRIEDMLAGRPRRWRFTTSEVNARLYPMYRKPLTHRCEASPALLLLMEAERCGLVRRTERHGRWVDIRQRVSIGEAMKRKEAMR